MTKITFVLESLCQLNNPRALHAYQIINELAATGVQIQIITAYETQSEFEFNYKNIQVLRPVKSFTYRELFRSLPMIFMNFSSEKLHIFAPFTHKNWRAMKTYRLLASVLKAVRNTPVSLSGYDPSFHIWPDPAIKNITQHFPMVFSHFDDQITQSQNLPMVFASPTQGSSVKDNSFKVLYINTDFKGLVKEKHLISTLEKFLQNHPHWKVCLNSSKESYRFLFSLYEISWQKKGILNQWIFTENATPLEADALLDVSKTWSETLYFLQIATEQNIPLITHSPILKAVKDRLIYESKNLYVIKNYQGSLFEKLFIIENSPHIDSLPLFTRHNDLATNIFTRSLLKGG